MRLKIDISIADYCILIDFLANYEYQYQKRGSPLYTSMDDLEARYPMIARRIEMIRRVLPELKEAIK